MTRKKTHEEFIAEVEAKYGNEYTILGNYKNAHSHILTRHNICGNEWNVKPCHLLRNNMCPKCSGLMKKTTESFKKEVFEKVREEYSVLSEYSGNGKKLQMKHNVCNQVYPVTPNKFLMGRRCPYCSGMMKKTHEQFVKEVFDLVGDDYTILGQYKTALTKIKIRHNLCNTEFLAKPNGFLLGYRCAFCSGNIKKTTEEYKKEVYDLVGNEFEVIGNYINALTKIEMKHNTCGFVFSMKPNNFLDQGQRCSKCNESKGEKAIAKWLNEKNISFEAQFKIDECKNINPLPFDFAVYLNDSFVLIEYQGEQHYEAIDFMGGKKGFKYRQKNDQIKKDYCKNNDIQLLEIPYWDFDNIDQILEEELLLMS